MRTVQLNVRLTEVEFGLLVEWSEAEHLSVAQYVRSKLFGKESRSEPVFGDVEEVFSKPSPPKTVGKKGKLCPRCSRAGKPSCDACRKAAAKSMVEEDK